MFDFLKGTRVVELGHVLLGPQTGQTLGDFGASVIKVESPSGDLYRNVGVKRNPRMSAQWLNCNRNKRSIAIDLKTDEGRKILADLIADADVFMHNMRPKAVARLGFDYESASKINPELVYCFSSGFGQDGPYADYPAFDDIIQAYSGIAHIGGINDDQPRLIPMAITDHLTSLVLAQAVLAALVRRAREGRGAFLEVPMLETVVSILLNQHLGGAAFEPPIGSPGYQRMLASSRKPCRTADGYVVHGVYTFEHWQRLLPTVGRDDVLHGGLLDTPDDLAANIADLYDVMADEIIPTRTTSDWLELFKSLDIPCAPIVSLDGLLSDPHLEAVGMLREYDHPTEGRVREITNPVRSPEAEAADDLPPPTVGQDTRAILSELGRKDSEIQSLINANIVSAG